MISTHTGIKFHFYADDIQVTAFEKLNSCLDDVKKWMLNLDKTYFILFGSKKQKEKLKECYPIDTFGSPLCPAESVKNLSIWFDSDFSLSKHDRSVSKVVLPYPVTSDTSDSFLLMMCLYLWPMLLLVVSWIIMFLFSEVSLSSIYIYYNVYNAKQCSKNCIKHE